MYRDIRTKEKKRERGRGRKRGRWKERERAKGRGKTENGRMQEDKRRDRIYIITKKVIMRKRNENQE